jgi:hypothetical protein
LSQSGFGYYNTDLNSGYVDGDVDIDTNVPPDVVVAHQRRVLEDAPVLGEQVLQRAPAARGAGQWLKLKLKLKLNARRKGFFVKVG